ncbi:helix-turn-helix domain-containing protein [Natronobeatus ordinarius]|uniref:helix-turn-helix domain-containing protein n=1 Tax=Natronobeatus ordinarius TaxID=2963433 RepID=UPI0020CD182A|nr:helix-turn-helix domain-containing protein [Natronobeatus ordinarius]
MTTVADLHVPATDTVLGSVFESNPSIVCEMEQVIASSGHRLWLAGATRAEIESALEAAPSVASHTPVLDSEERWLYEVEFADSGVNVFELIADETGTVLSASAADGRWHLTARFADREDVSRVYDRLVDRDVTANLVRLTDLTETQSSTTGLTPKQYETLVAAHEYGYFGIPRETSMQELAEQLGVSHQALSERLRRAYRALVATELNAAEDGDAPPIEAK